MYYYEIVFTIYKDGEVLDTRTVGLEHEKPRDISHAKSYAATQLGQDEKHLPITIMSFKPISFEEWSNRFNKRKGSLP